MSPEETPPQLLVVRAGFEPTANHYEGHAPESIEKLKRLWNTGFTK